MDLRCHRFSTQNQNAHTDLPHNILMETDEMRKTKKDRSRKKTRVNKQTHYPATLFSSANQEIQKTYSVAAVALSLFSTISVALIAFISTAVTVWCCKTYTSFGVAQLQSTFQTITLSPVIVVC